MAWQHMTGCGGVSQSTLLDFTGSVLISSEEILSLPVQQDTRVRLNAKKAVNLKCISVDHGSSG